jgi:hypothetical protein
VPAFADAGVRRRGRRQRPNRTTFYPKSILPKEAAVSKTHRLLIGAGVIAASLAPAGSAFALSAINHNELLLLDD